jgi:hypothetical protein
VLEGRAVVWPIAIKGSPFRGLAAFGAKHAPVFFRRVGIKIVSYPHAFPEGIRPHSHASGIPRQSMAPGERQGS